MSQSNQPAGVAVDRGVGRLFADAIDADRLARGEAPKCEPTEKRVFDDDIEVARFSCHECGSKRWHRLGLRHVGETDYGDIEVDEYRCADCKTVAGW